MTDYESLEHQIHHETKWAGQAHSQKTMSNTIMLAVKRVEFVSDRMSYIILRGRWCNIIVLNVHAPTEDKTDDIKDRFYEELEQVFDKLPKYHMKILLDFNVKVGREDIFKPTIGNESLHEISNDNRVRVVNFTTSKKSYCHKYNGPRS
jgi:exonuclease III